MNVALIDNYDSFTWNLVHYLGELGANVDVYRNDAITVDELKAKKPDAVVLSPGPCTPNEAGICLDVIKEMGAQTPIFGVCRSRFHRVHNSLRRRRRPRALARAR